MQYLPIGSIEDFGGIDVVPTPDNVSDKNSPDSRNEDISQPGSAIKRNGIEKQNTSAYSYQLNYMVAITVKGTDYTLYIDSNGNMVVI